MKTPSAANKKRLTELHAELKTLQAQLAHAYKLEGRDTYIDVTVKESQARFQRVRQQGAEDKAVGVFYLEIAVTAERDDVFIPLSMASGKKVAGFMYQIEGTAAGTIVSADVRVRGKGVSQVTVGTLLYAKIPAGTTALFEIRATIRGKFSKTYKIVISRLNYKLALADARYQQYLKEIPSDDVTLS